MNGAVGARVSELGRDEAPRFLGLVPSVHDPQLALHSVVVVKPSSFEVWSANVEEARSLSVPLVLSEIGVNHEQADGQARFFDPRSGRSASDALLRAWHASGVTLGQQLANAGPVAAESSHAFAARFARALESAAGRIPGPTGHGS